MSKYPSWRLIAVQKASTEPESVSLCYARYQSTFAQLPIKSALYALAHTAEIYLYKATNREWLCLPEDEVFIADVSQTCTKELPISVVHSILALVSAKYVKICRTPAWLIKTGETVYISLCESMYVWWICQSLGMQWRLCAEGASAALSSTLPPSLVSQEEQRFNGNHLVSYWSPERPTKG